MTHRRKRERKLDASRLPPFRSGCTSRVGGAVEADVATEAGMLLAEAAVAALGGFEHLVR